MSLYREHGSGYLRPRIKPAAETAVGALILTACLGWLGPICLDMEEDMPVPAPITVADMVTPEGLAAYRSEYECCSQDHVCNQGRGCPMRNPAEASTHIGAEPTGRPRDGWLTGLWLRFVRAMT